MGELLRRDEIDERCMEGKSEREFASVAFSGSKISSKTKVI